MPIIMLTALLQTRKKIRQHAVF